MDSISAREKFYARHGEWVRTEEGPIIFENGATDAEPDSNWGRLMEPSEDKWEKAKIIARYWMIKANAAITEFETFQSALRGHGYWPCDWGKLNTEEKQLKFLKRLRNKARDAKAEFAKAKRAVKRHTPFWMQDERIEAEDAAAKQNFLNQVDRVQL